MSCAGWERTAKATSLTENNIYAISQQAQNIYKTLVLGHIYITSYMNVYATLLTRL